MTQEQSAHYEEMVDVIVNKLVCAAAMQTNEKYWLPMYRYLALRTTACLLNCGEYVFTDQKNFDSVFTLAISDPVITFAKSKENNDFEQFLHRLNELLRRLSKVLVMRARYIGFINTSDGVRQQESQVQIYCDQELVKVIIEQLAHIAKGMSEEEWAPMYRYMALKTTTCLLDGGVLVFEHDKKFRRHFENEILAPVTAHVGRNEKFSLNHLLARLSTALVARACYESVTANARKMYAEKDFSFSPLLR